MPTPWEWERVLHLQVVGETSSPTYTCRCKNCSHTQRVTSEPSSYATWFTYVFVHNNFHLMLFDGSSSPHALWWIKLRTFPKCRAGLSLVPGPPYFETVPTLVVYLTLSVRVKGDRCALFWTLLKNELSIYTLVSLVDLLDKACGAVSNLGKVL
jgi:hypothetical protein